MLEIRLLGTVEMLVSGYPVDLGTRRQRLMLAVLALEANRFVPVGRLVSLCWSGAPPRTAVHAVQVAASHLRTTLTRAGGVRYGVELASAGSAYALRAGSGCVDVQAFRHLVSQARGAAGDEHRAAMFRQALLLWRGPALTGIGPEQMREGLARGLEEARLVATEDAIAAELSMGRHLELLDELNELTEAHPLRERLIAELMLALYRSGQGASALAVFQRARHRLAEELGIDPGAELRQLELSILRGEPLTAATPLPAAPSDPATPINGRRPCTRGRAPRGRIQGAAWRCCAPADPRHNRRLHPGRAVYAFAEQVSMAVVPGVFLDHVHVYPPHLYVGLAV
jgi:DNA-binding SARP family transcriptional activator